MRHRRRHRRSRHPSRADRGTDAARVSRLRLGRHRGHRRRRRHAAPAHRRQSRAAQGSARGRACDRLHRHRPHPLGYPRCAIRAQRASARLGWRYRHRAQRHHREPRSASGRIAGARLHVHVGNGHRGDRPSNPSSPRGRQGACRSRRRLCARVARRLRSGGDRRRRSRHRARRTRWLSGGHRSRNRRQLCGLRRVGALAGHARVSVSGGRRRRVGTA